MDDSTEMKISGRPTWADIDLSALLHNLDQARHLCRAGQRVMAVVKADAYGHGAIPVTRALIQAGVADFAVATLEEALALRSAGIENDLLVLGGCYTGQEQDFIGQRLMPVVFDLAAARRLNKAGLASGQQIRIHLKVDTGMERAGLAIGQLQQFLDLCKDSPGLVVQGVMSHLACADDPAAAATTQQQVEVFGDVLRQMHSAGVSPVDIHLCNSAGIATQLCPECTLVRPGIMLYGGLPGVACADVLDLKPVMHLRSCISHLRQLPAGAGVSYGHSYRTQHATTIAVLPIGYADGYNRLLSNCGHGIVRGVKVPVVGRVCMDWIMLDVSALPQVAVADCVTLMGSADGQLLSGDELAAQLGSISYEVFCRISRRVPRRYLE